MPSLSLFLCHGMVLLLSNQCPFYYLIYFTISLLQSVFCSTIVERMRKYTAFYLPFSHVWLRMWVCTEKVCVCLGKGYARVSCMHACVCVCTYLLVWFEKEKKKKSKIRIMMYFHGALMNTDNPQTSSVPLRLRHWS